MLLKLSVLSGNRFALWRKKRKAKTRFKHLLRAAKTEQLAALVQQFKSQKDFVTGGAALVGDRLLRAAFKALRKRVDDLIDIFEVAVHVFPLVDDHHLVSMYGELVRLVSDALNIPSVVVQKKAVACIACIQLQAEAPYSQEQGQVFAALTALSWRNTEPELSANAFYAMRTVIQNSGDFDALVECHRLEDSFQSAVHAAKYSLHETVKERARLFLECVGQAVSGRWSRIHRIIEEMTNLKSLGIVPRIARLPTEVRVDAPLEHDTVDSAENFGRHTLATRDELEVCNLGQYVPTEITRNPTCSDTPNICRKPGMETDSSLEAHTQSRSVESPTRFGTQSSRSSCLSRKGNNAALSRESAFRNDDVQSHLRPVYMSEQDGASAEDASRRTVESPRISCSSRKGNDSGLSGESAIGLDDVPTHANPMNNGEQERARAVDVSGPADENPGRPSRPLYRPPRPLYRPPRPLYRPQLLQKTDIQQVVTMKPCSPSLLWRRSGSDEHLREKSASTEDLKVPSDLPQVRPIRTDRRSVVRSDDEVGSHHSSEGKLGSSTGTSTGTQGDEICESGSESHREMCDDVMQEMLSLDTGSLLEAAMRALREYCEDQEPRDSNREGSSESHTASSSSNTKGDENSSNESDSGAESREMCLAISREISAREVIHESLEESASVPRLFLDVRGTRRSPNRTLLDKGTETNGSVSELCNEEEEKTATQDTALSPLQLLSARCSEKGATSPCLNPEEIYMESRDAEVPEPDEEGRMEDDNRVYSASDTEWRIDNTLCSLDEHDRDLDCLENLLQGIRSAMQRRNRVSPISTQCTPIPFPIYAPIPAGIDNRCIYDRVPSPVLPLRQDHCASILQGAVLEPPPQQSRFEQRTETLEETDASTGECSVENLLRLADVEGTELANTRNMSKQLKNLLNAAKSTPSPAQEMPSDPQRAAPNERGRGAARANRRGRGRRPLYRNQVAPSQ